MFANITGFELRYQLRNPVFWVVAILFFLLTFGGMTIEQIRIGGGGNIHRNSPVAIFQYHFIFSLFFMFVTTAFVANVVIRDDESGFGGIVRSTRVRKFDYLIGRFAGAYLAALVAFLVVPLAMWLGSLMPWVDSETLGPNRIAAYAFGYFAIAVPNILITSAIFFAVATMTRSMMLSYVGVVVFLILYFTTLGVLRVRPELRELAGYIEPFGAAAIGKTTRYWTAAEANAQIPPLDSLLIANRLIWTLISLGVLALAYARFSFAERGLSKRKLARVVRREARLAATAPMLVARLPDPRPGAANLTRLVARIRFEMAQILRSPAFFVLILIGLLNSITGLAFAGELYGTPLRPLTFAIISTLLGTFGIFPIIIAIYYSGELVWRDRDRRMHEIVDATSLPNWAYLAPKTLALVTVLFSSYAIAIVGGIVVQLARGVIHPDLGQYFLWLLLPATADAVILALLAIFVQALSPNKYVGWGVMVLYLVATITLNNIGFDHPLYNYGATGTVAFSDMNGDHVGGVTAWWLRLYWGFVALVLAVLAHLLWRRGTQVALRPRLARLPARLVGGAGALGALGVAGAAATGAYLYWNMDVRNDYRTQEMQEARLADYEKKYLKYETLKQPSVTDIKLDVALFPREKRMEAKGSYALINDTGAPLRDLHVRFFDPELKILSVEVPGARLVLDDAKNQYRIYRYDRPLAPGAKASLSFTSRRWQQGMRVQGDDNRLVENGTFLNNGEFSPFLGMNRTGLLQDRTKRRKHGLPAELRMAKLEDESARERNYIADADWVNSDITVTTDAGQTPIAPGRKVADVSKDGRRTAHFVSTAPILAFFSVQSAAYAQKSADLGGGVTGTVFYDPKHDFNVDRMLKAMKLSLDYYRANFGPYQFDYARIIEFPGYQSFAQAFAGTIPYSERIGFIADARDPDAIDYVTYVTAHELGHQYWAHQIISSDQQGGTVLVETMAQYSAMMVMKHLYGEDKMRRFLKYELDNYLRSRGGELIEELPLERVENQPYIHYRKGSLVMYLLQDRLGEARMNTMLRALLDKYRFKSQPYARSLDLVDGLKGLARNDAERQLVRDLFERITIFDLKAKKAVVRKLPDGRYETTLTIEAGKAYADGKGKETKAPLDDMIDVGLFSAEPGIGAFSSKDVIAVERRRVQGGTQEIRLVTAKKPSRAGIDPYNKYIDRNSDDNVVAVSES